MELHLFSEKKATSKLKTFFREPAKMVKVYVSRSFLHLHHQSKKGPQKISWLVGSSWSWNSLHFLLVLGGLSFPSWFVCLFACLSVCLFVEIPNRKQRILQSNFLKTSLSFHVPRAFVLSALRHTAVHRTGDVFSGGVEKPATKGRWKTKFTLNESEHLLKMNLGIIPLICK